MRDLKYLLAYLIPLSAWIGIEYRGFWVWAAFILTFGIVPVLDAVLPASTRNVPAEEEEKRSNRFFLICSFMPVLQSPLFSVPVFPNP
ncbi:MAG: hypothetical protein U5K51_16175 [Flavobacteriaceae bacterium]|nr:hypothetical protein [Flavobacteriaceae bacterium]